jgi:hypothetical protein
MVAGAVRLSVADAGLATVSEPRTAPAYCAAPRVAPAGAAKSTARGLDVLVNARAELLVIMPHNDNVDFHVSMVPHGGRLLRRRYHPGTQRCHSKP